MGLGGLAVLEGAEALRARGVMTEEMAVVDLKVRGVLAAPADLAERMESAVPAVIAVLEGLRVKEVLMGEMVVVVLKVKEDLAEREVPAVLVDMMESVDPADPRVKGGAMEEMAVVVLKVKEDLAEREVPADLVDMMESVDPAVIAVLEALRVKGGAMEEMAVVVRRDALEREAPRVVPAKEALEALVVVPPVLVDLKDLRETLVHRAPRDLPDLQGGTILVISTLKCLLKAEVLSPEESWFLLIT
jgi:hypothetical protein